MRQPRDAPEGPFSHTLPVEPATTSEIPSNPPFALPSPSPLIEEEGEGIISSESPVHSKSRRGGRRRWPPWLLSSPSSSTGLLFLLLAYVLCFLANGDADVGRLQQQPYVPAIRQPLRPSFSTSPSPVSSSSGTSAPGGKDLLSIVISTIDGGVHTVDAWTGQSRGLFYSGPPLYSSSFFLGSGNDNKFAESRVNPRNNKYFVMPTLEGRIVCVREDGTQEILAPNVLDLIDNPVMSCPDYEESCGLLLGEKTTKIFALDGRNGHVKWVNSKFKLGGGTTRMGQGKPQQEEQQQQQHAGGNKEAFPPTTASTTTPGEGGRGGGGGGKDPPILLQRDDYVIRSLNVQDGREEWNVTMSEIFAIGTTTEAQAEAASKYIGGARQGQGASADDQDDEEDFLPIVPDIQWLDERTLRVLHPESQEILWERELAAAPIGMYTVRNNKWLHMELPEQRSTEGGSSSGNSDSSSRRLGGGRLLTGGDSHPLLTAGGGGGNGNGARIGGNQLMGPMGTGGAIAMARAARKYGIVNPRVGLPRPGEDSYEDGNEKRSIARQLMNSFASSFSFRRMLDYIPLPLLLPASWKEEKNAAKEKEGGGDGQGEARSSSNNNGNAISAPTTSLVERIKRRQRECSEWEVAYGRCASPWSSPSSQAVTAAGTIYDVMVTAPPTSPRSSCNENGQDGGVCDISKGTTAIAVRPPHGDALPHNANGSGNGAGEGGLYLTYETMATLIIAVFVFAVGFVLMLYQHKPGFVHKEEGNMLNGLSELMLKHQQQRHSPRIEAGSSENTTATTGTSSSSSDGEDSRASPSLQRRRNKQALTIDPRQSPTNQLLLYQRQYSDNLSSPKSIATNYSSVASGKSSSNSHFQPRFQRSSSLSALSHEEEDNNSSRSGVSGAAGKTNPPRGARTMRASGTPSFFPDGEASFDGEKSKGSSMEGQPIQRLRAIHHQLPPAAAKKSPTSASQSPPEYRDTSPRPPGDLNETEDTGSGSMANGGTKPSSLSSAKPPLIGVKLLPVAKQESQVSSSSTSPRRSSTTPATGTTGTTAQLTVTTTTAATSSSTSSGLETITDSSGNPILFLSTQRYKNEFKELAKLGKGGFGTVFKSTNKLDGHEYAIKKIRLSSASHWSNQLEKVLREVKILALLDHPNIIRYYQAWLERLSPEDLLAAANAAAYYPGDSSFSDIYVGDSHSRYLGEDSLLLMNRSSHHPHSLSSGLRPGDVSQRGSHGRLRPASVDLHSSGANPHHHLLHSPQQYLSPVRPTSSLRRSSDLRSPSLENEDEEEEHDDEEEGDEEGEGGTGGGSGRRIGGAVAPPALPPRFRPPSGKLSNCNSLIEFDEESRISQWSEEDEDDENTCEDDEGASQYSKSELDDDLSQGLVVWTRPSDVSLADTNDIPSRPSTPGTPRASPGRGGEGTTGVLTPKGPKTPRQQQQQQQQKRDGNLPLTPPSSVSSLGFPYRRGSSGTSPSSRLRGGAGGGFRGTAVMGGGGGGSVGKRRRRPVREQTVFDLCLYIQMQYCSNRTLKDFLEQPERKKTVDKAQALQISLQVARGVKYVHERGLIHRDLKPTNCFLVGDGNTVKIGDFGLSRHVGPQGEETPALVPASPRGGAAPARGNRFVDYDNTAGVGTPVYGSPEQLSGGDYDEKTDVYSLGVILFELFHPAFGTGMERMLTMRKIHEGQLPEEWVNGNVELVDVLQRMLNSNPARRPRAADVVAKLEFLQGKPLVLPIEFDQFPKDAVLLRAETGERDGMLQEVINGIKQHGTAGLMKQYGFRSCSDGRAVIEVLLDGSQIEEIEVILKHLRAMEDMLSCNLVGVGIPFSSTTSSSVSSSNVAVP